MMSSLSNAEIRIKQKYFLNVKYSWQSSTLLLILLSVKYLLKSTPVSGVLAGWSGWPGLGRDVGAMAGRGLRWSGGWTGRLEPGPGRRLDGEAGHWGQLRSAQQLLEWWRLQTTVAPHTHRDTHSGEYSNSRQITNPAGTQLTHTLHTQLKLKHSSNTAQTNIKSCSSCSS